MSLEVEGKLKFSLTEKKLGKSIVGVQFVMQFLDIVPVLIIDSYLHLHQLWQITVSSLTI